MHANQPKQKVAMFTMVEIVLMLGGLMILLGFFMDWVSYRYVADTVAIKGSEFGRIVGNYPETLLLPFIGLMFVAGGFFSAGRRRAFMPQKVSRGLFLATAWIAAIVAMFITVYLTIRYSDHLQNSIGITIYNNLDIGWYITISGNIILYIGCILLVSNKARAIGFSDYFYVRADSAAKMTDIAKPPAPTLSAMPVAQYAPQPVMAPPVQPPQLQAPVQQQPRPAAPVQQAPPQAPRPPAPAPQGPAQAQTQQAKPPVQAPPQQAPRPLSQTPPAPPAPQQQARPPVPPPQQGQQPRPAAPVAPQAPPPPPKKESDEWK